MLFYLLAAKISKESLEHLSFLVKKILSQDISSEAQLLGNQRKATTFPLTFQSP